MKASTYTNLEGILKDEKQKAVFFIWIVDVAMQNPKLFLNIIMILVKIGKLIAGNFYNKDGTRRTPWWAKLLGVFGIKFVNDVQTLGDEADKGIKELKIPAIYEHE